MANVVRPGAIVALALVALVSLAAWSGSGGSDSVGGYEVGPTRCTGPSAPHADDCRRLLTFGHRLLEQAPHAHVSSVAVYEEPETGYHRMISGAGDFAIVAFTLADAAVRAFYVRCGAGFDETLCTDLRPLRPGFRPEDVGPDAPMASNANPVSIP
jgi:hypothetical protein